ncbi:AraC family transcriptional regulator [Limosilactobacillus sp.]|jgi:AraC-like DNA-binding protein|uniref:AraC family transcriptional regulator n=1 Tax=Limosilactobacillus sp. TaxID=2773925 RepID=UPI0025B835CC|nr:AraC family transcriptional regulator [Limosilactobacillus sp.]MCH3923258.1 AraC family transcriptional regulator [Limosilactobacillus sp.]MCH3927940.1 AraC family transcriptional regulator [Limosilactobacillus sp.]
MELDLSKQFIGMLEQSGINFSTLYQKAKLPISVGEELELNDEQYIQVMRVLDQELDDQQLLQLSNINNLQQFIPSFYAALASPDGITALERFARYKKVVGPVDVKLTKTPQEVTLSFTHQTEAIPRFMLLNEQILVVSLLRIGSGQEITPKKVKGPYRYGAVVENYLGIKGEFSADNQLVFSSHDLDQAFITENNIMWKYLKPSLDQELQNTANSAGTKEKVQQLLLDALPGNQATIEAVASQLGMSDRTLQRKLKEEGTTFKNVVTKVQKQLAQSYIRNGVNTDEIAYLVGYTETSSFLRAFKRWTGQTVGQFKLLASKA